VNEAGLEQRVLVLAPTGQDSANTSLILDRAGLSPFLCRGIVQLCAEMERGAGAVLVTTEAFATESIERLQQSLQRQPTWSDLPIVVLTRGGPDSPVGLQALAQLGNAIALERPVRVSTLVAATRGALRQRGQQYRIRQQFETLAEQDRRKDEFLAMLAHELRNPLAPIRHGVQLIRGGKLDGEQLRWINGVMDRQVDHLTRLVDDLLDVSRITSGKIRMEPRPLRLDAVMSAAVETVRQLIEQRGQHLHLLPPADELRVNGDETRLIQVVANLLHNAAKYGHVGGNIWLSAAREEGERAVLRVRDDGIGIAPQLQRRVFDLFVQADNSLDRSQGGLGLGLTLVRRVVEMHGGSVGVHSEGKDRGAEFKVSLPLLKATPVASQAQPAQALALRRYRILVADDNVDLAESLAMVLQLSGHEVCQAYTGAEAIAASDRLHPDILVLDIGLPDLSGHEVARRLRGGPAAAALLIALSGYAQEEHRRKALAAGFDHYLVKPVDFDLLDALLAAPLPARTA
jgi:signal transduction histidine kinase/ActR/RegA family two-component response regulator